MKLLCAEYNEAGEVAYNVIGDNALLRNNDDFYIPAFATELSCVPQIVLRIGKIGKHVAERFAERYYEEVGVGIRFYADNLERELLATSLSPSAAMAFDSSAAISSMKSLAGVSLEDMIFSFELNGESVLTGKVGEISQKPEKTLAVMSEYYMLKIGDFLFCGGVFRGPPSGSFRRGMFTGLSNKMIEIKNRVFKNPIFYYLQYKKRLIL